MATTQNYGHVNELVTTLNSRRTEMIRSAGGILTLIQEGTNRNGSNRVNLFAPRRPCRASLIIELTRGTVAETWLMNNRYLPRGIRDVDTDGM